MHLLKTFIELKKNPQFMVQSVRSLSIPYDHLSKFGEFMVSNNLDIGSAPNTLTMLCRKHACSINFPQLCLFEPKMSMILIDDK